MEHSEIAMSILWRSSCSHSGKAKRTRFGKQPSKSKNLEKERATYQKRKDKRDRQTGESKSSTKSDVKRRSDCVKDLPNDGEPSTACSMMVQRGVAPPTDNIISQLKRKFPVRRKAIQWLRRERIDELSKLVKEIIAIERDVNPRINIKDLAGKELEAESFRYLKDQIENNFQAVQIQ